MEQPNNDFFFGMTEQEIKEYKEAEKRIEQEQIEQGAKDGTVKSSVVLAFLPRCQKSVAMWEWYE